MVTRDVISVVKKHVEAMLSNETDQSITLYLGEEVFETVTGKSRGEGSISIHSATRYTEHGLAEIVALNDEVRGRSGTAHKRDLFAVLDEEEKLAQEQGRTLRVEVGVKRDRRATWQQLNDDAARGGTA